MEEICQRFREKREKLGISLRKAEKDTKIRIDYLRAIEEGNFNRVNGKVFLKGFLKVYSDYLGLEKEEILQMYQQTLEDEVSDEVKNMTLKDKIMSCCDKYQNKLLAISIGIVGIVFIVLVVYLGSQLYGFVGNFKSQDVIFAPIKKVQKFINRVEKDKSVEEKLKSNIKTVNSDQEEIADQQEQLNSTSMDKQKMNYSSQEELQIKEANFQEGVPKKEIKIKVKAVEKSWFSVEVDGKKVIKGIIKKGEEKLFTGQSIKFKIGNAAGVVLIKDGKQLGPLGDKGEVITKAFSISTK